MVCAPFLSAENCDAEVQFLVSFRTKGAFTIIKRLLSVNVVTRNRYRYYVKKNVLNENHPPFLSTALQRMNFSVVDKEIQKEV